jgi:hypothetical protein
VGEIPPARSYVYRESEYVHPGEKAESENRSDKVKGFLAFITLVALLVFAMGLVTHAADTGQIINASSSGLVKLFSLELGQVPGTKTTAKKTG